MIVLEWWIFPLALRFEEEGKGVATGGESISLFEKLKSDGSTVTLYA